MTILAGYLDDPVWYQLTEDQDMLHAVDEAAEQLGLTDGLARALTAWDDEYQATLNHEYPPDSTFPSPAVRQAWVERGKELAAQIKRESPVVSSVDYQADGCYDKGSYVF
ncbi:hypothetical protein [Actinoalloteichus sp. GBA129-24]|uniref:hypothetical protein n=1 Tax=Actinoalloteichus sp. GBA129-24 TaxID=1612551 RepID=UPI00095126B1|nr:hypothetical protein [Actinoalloteichus sp. GBA129-24]